MPRRPKLSRDHNAGNRVNPHDHTNVAVKPYKNNPRTVWIIQHTPGASYIPSFLTGVAAVAHELPPTEPSMGMGAMLSATRGLYLLGRRMNRRPSPTSGITTLRPFRSKTAGVLAFQKSGRTSPSLHSILEIHPCGALHERFSDCEEIRLLKLF